MDSFDFRVGRVPPGFEHRADLISNLFYDTPTLDWLICWFVGGEILHWVFGSQTAFLTTLGIKACYDNAV
jgi:hypothetical protein